MHKEKNIPVINRKFSIFREIGIMKIIKLLYRLSIKQKKINSNLYGHGVVITSRRIEFTILSI